MGNGLEYPTPPIPRDEKEILYYNLPKKEQYFRTNYNNDRSLYIPTDSELRKWSEKDRIEFVNKWRERWCNGMWVFIDGQPTYLTGMYIDHLCINKFNNRYFNYNESQRDDFYFRDLIWHMDEVDGMQWLKPRRYGMSMEEITQSIYVLLSDYNNNVAIQSDTLDKAHNTLMLPLIETYINRPRWTREDFYRSNGKRPRKSLELTDVKATDDGEGLSWLGGKVTAYPTNAKAADGTENMYDVIDEFSKYSADANPRQLMDVNLKTIRNAGRRGKLSALSTSGDSDDVLISFKEWVKLTGESTVVGNQTRTISGLIKRFVSSLWSQYLPMELLPNKYGKIDAARNQEWVENEVNKKQKGTKEYFFEKRRLPLIEDDALIASTDVNYFRKAAIVSRRKYLSSLRYDQKPYVRGNLVEKTDTGGVVKVYFEHNEDGVWMVSIHPYFDAARNIDCRNRFKYSERQTYWPVINPEFIAGYDPIRYRKEDTKTGHLSRAAIKVWKVWDYHNAPNSIDFIQDAPAALYVGRPDRPEDAHKEFCKAMKYWGAIGSFERQVESVKTEIEAQNMLPMAIVDADGIAGIWTTTKVIDDGLEKMVNRLAAPKEEDQKDHIETAPFEDELIDWENFDRANTGKFDIMMADIMVEKGIPFMPYTNAKEESMQKLSEIIREITPKRKKANAFS